MGPRHEMYDTEHFGQHHAHSFQIVYEYDTRYHTRYLQALLFYKKLKNVSCEYDRVNG